jgi:hypothetical protein
VKTKNKYIASNVVLYHEPTTGRIAATSYIWWVFLIKNSDGKIIFNDYPYSTSTRKHQRDVLKQLDILGIKIDHFIESRESLSACWQPNAIKLLVDKITTLNTEIAAKGSKKAKNVERATEIERCRIKITEITTIN